MIAYPDDPSVEEQARTHGLPEPVLIRDLVRIVEVLNLDAQGFFNEKSVLAGSMALRCFGSPRFTVYDADFSAVEESKPRPDQVKSMLAYSDDDLEIVPATLTPHNRGGTAWKSEPITFTPIFTDLAPPKERRFKADFSFRGLVRDGVQRRLLVPYDLGIWSEPPTIWVMEPHEVVAEKVLGWCENRLLKHYADLGFIAIASMDAGPIELNSAKLRSALDDKLSVMKGLQPDKYAAYGGIDQLIDELGKVPVFESSQWMEIIYIRSKRDRFDQKLLVNAVRNRLVPLLRDEISS